VTEPNQRIFDDAQTSTRLRVCELASGGMGRVDLALRREGKFRRLYAVKRLHPHLQDDEEFRAMFVDEARVAGLIQHPNVVGVLDVGEDEDGPFLVMSFVDGLSLAILLAFAKESDTALPLQAAIRIAHEITKGLHAAHELVDHEGRPLHLVHRDLSPQNVLIGWDGTVRITDFGIAKALGRSTKTATGVVKGKTSYMSPEQLRYEEADRRSDLFALGIIIYEMVAGERLYRNRDGQDGIRRILQEPPPDIGEVRPEAPPALTALIFRLLAKDRESRPSTAAEVGANLEEILTAILEDEPPINLATLLTEVTGHYREERKKALAELIAKAEKESADEPIVAMARPRRTQAQPQRNASTPWIAAGVLALLVVVGVSAWAIGRMGAEEEVGMVGAPPPAETEAEADSNSEAETDSDSEAEAEAEAEAASEPASNPTPAGTESAMETETPSRTPRMRRRRRSMRRPMRNQRSEGVTSGATMWDEWE
jgi:serine/threonine-protein kinase